MKFLVLVFISVFILGVVSVNAQSWDQIIKTCASDRQADDNFGCSVSIDGDYAIVGAKYEDHDLVGGSTQSGAGSAYIFKNDGGTWTQVQKIVASDREYDDWFGNSVAISGDYAIIGAYGEDEDETGANTLESAGSVYVFKNISGTWTEVQKIVASDRTSDDYFGYSVDIYGDYFVVGAYMEDENASGGTTMSNAGSAYIFYNNAGTWEQTQKIVASDRYQHDYFGYAVAVDNDLLIVGAYNEDENVAGSGSLNSAGSAYIFKNNAGTWAQMQKIVASDRAESDYFGWSVDICGDYAIVGAYGEDEDEIGGNTLIESGSAYVFKNNTGTWSEIDKIVASDREFGDRFGYTVAINGDYAVVGAYLEDEDENGLNSHDNAGSAYIFKNNAGNWAQEQKIVSSNRYPADWFGVSVAISDIYLYVGAQLEDYDINGENNYPGAGSAYIFQNCREINIRQNTTDIANGGEYSFGVIPVGENSGEIIFTIENTGVDDLLLTGAPKIEISGADADKFIIDQSAVISPILPQSSTTFTIRFTPESINLHTAEISISNNDNDENPYIFTINGSGGNLTQTISGFEAIPDKTYGDEAFVVSATASSGLDVIFTSSDENVATCTGTNGSTITIINAGTCQIFANQPGNAIYLPATEVPQTLNINVKPIDVTANSGQLKIYGDADPEFTFTVDPELVAGDNFTGTLSRYAGEDVEYYGILQGTLTAGANYDITFITNDFAIVAKPVTVTVDAGQSKVYGASNPAYTYSVAPALVGGDSFVGVLTRVTGEDVGFYEIQQGTLSLSANYDLSFVSDDFEITQKTITVTATAGLTKVYGIGDPVLTYNYTPSLVIGDSFSGSLSRDAGEDAGLYAITQGTLDLGTNYNILFVSNDFEILQKPITVVAYSNQFKTYGQSDPTFAYYSVPSPITEDVFTGALSRVVGEDVGYYAIELGSLTLGPNYDISLTSADFQIKIKNIIILVDEGQSKEYGDDDPVEYTYTTNTPIAAWDSFTGALTRDPGEAVGTYAILQGTLSLNANYNVSFVSEDFSITIKQITVTADPDQTKVYGDADPAEFTYTVTGTLVSGDEFTGALTRDFGENIGIYQIKKGSLSLGENYNLIYVADYFHITPKPVTITANAGQTKVYGESDPVITFTITGELVSGDTYSGALSRESGQNIGFYEILQGSLVLPNNYDVTYVSADFEITPKPVTITADAGQSKVYGESDPELTFTLTGELVSGDSYSGALSRVEGENAGLYQILQGSLVLPNNYDVSYVSDDFEILKATSVITWENPADIIVGTALSAAQLNATADVDGTFDYNPESGTVLAVGNDQALYVLFTPTDITNYNTAEKTVYINVLLDSKICDQNIISANIYPNPTNGLLIINNEGIGISEVSLINTTGQVIFVEKMNTDKINLDLSDLPAGAYLLILNTDNGIINEKIIKR